MFRVSMLHLWPRIDRNVYTLRLLTSDYISLGNGCIETDIEWLLVQASQETVHMINAVLTEEHFFVYPQVTRYCWITREKSKVRTTLWSNPVNFWYTSTVTAAARCFSSNSRRVIEHKLPEQITNQPLSQRQPRGNICHTRLIMYKHYYRWHIW